MSAILSGSYDNFIESSFLTSSFSPGEKVAVVSIPQQLYGNNIEPGSFSLNLSGTGYVDGGYVNSGYVLSGSTGLIYDNGEGLILHSGSTVGRIQYAHGLAVIFDININTGIETVNLVDYFSENTDYNINFKSNYTVYTLNIHCKSKDTEHNLTFNPSALSGSNGDLKTSLTGSEFNPYVTTIGLYNDSSELVAVAKLNQPIPKSQDTDTTFQIKLDI